MFLLSLLGLAYFQFELIHMPDNNMHLGAAFPEPHQFPLVKLP